MGQHLKDEVSTGSSVPHHLVHQSRERSRQARPRGRGERPGRTPRGPLERERERRNLGLSLRTWLATSQEIAPKMMGDKEESESAGIEPDPGPKGTQLDQTEPEP